jgi:hypothetical protein
MDDRRFPIHYRYRGPISDLVYEVVDYYVYLGEDGEPTGKVDHVVQAEHGIGPASLTSSSAASASQP